jgi:outer membrane protein assembly factor BamB
VNIAYGNLYVGSLNGSLFALNSVTGTIIWRYDTGGFILGTPSASDEIVYVANASGWGMRGLDAFTGKEVWSKPAPPPPGFWIWTNFWSCPVVSGRYIFISNNDGHVYCFDRYTGQVAWRSERSGHEFWGIPAVADGIAYFGGGDGNVYAIGDFTE